MKKFLVRSMFWVTLVSFMLLSMGCATTRTGQIYHERTTCVPGQVCEVHSRVLDADGVPNVVVPGETIAGIPASELAQHPGTHTSGNLLLDTPQGPVQFKYEVHDTPEPKGWCDNWWCPTLLTIGGVAIIGAAIGYGMSDGGDVHVDRTVHTR